MTQLPINAAEFFGQIPDPACGAVSTFIGRVRNHHQGKPVQKLYYECYEVLAAKQIADIAVNLKREFQVKHIRILHRVGWIEIGEVAVAIEVQAAHRDEAFKACRAVIEAIKKTVPIWKKELYTDGTESWVMCTHPTPHLLKG